MRKMLTVGVMLMALSAMGCNWTQKWMAGGAVVGATAGGIWAGNAGILSIAEGALVGAAAGATAGAMIGSVMDYDDYKTAQATIEELQAANDELTRKNSQLENDLQACKSELESARRKIKDLEAQIAKLTDELAKCKGARVEISMAADTLFKPGSATLSKEGQAALDSAADKIKQSYSGKFIQIEGHTDSDPIKLSSWKSNWELGSARSMAVVRYLSEKGVDASKLSAATFGEYAPVADNSTKEGKAQNRRAVIVIYTGLPRAK